MIKKSYVIESPKSGTIRTYTVGGVRWYSLYDLSSALGFSHSLSVENAPAETVMLITTSSSKLGKNGNSKVNRRRDMYVINGEGLLHLILNLNYTFNSLKTDVLFGCGAYLPSVEEIVLERLSCNLSEVKLNERV